MKSHKSEHYSSIIKENSGNKKVLLKTVQKLLQKPTVNYYPFYSAECVTGEVLTTSSTKFSTFTEMKLDDIRELAATLFSKSCVLDPLPSSITKQCTNLLLPTITNIVNLSLREGWMPTCLKSAVLSPLIKKPDADFLQFKNFRPMVKRTVSKGN